MRGYLFIANGREVPRKIEKSMDPVKIGSFEEACIFAANKNGLKLYMGINRDFADKLKSQDYDISFYNQHIYRNIFGIKDLYIAYRNLVGFLRTHPDIDIIHCNTPIGGFLGRICGHKFHKKVIYTAHGFHFYEGAPLINRMVFKPVEMWLAHKTDVLITINKEDYEVAQKFRLKKGGRVYYVPGVGINTHSFEGLSINKKEKRESLGIPQDAVLCIIVGDLNDNKNVETLVRALPSTQSCIHYIICGFGPNEKRLKVLAKELGVEGRCHFLGYRTDVKELYLISDMFLFASQREGLPRSTMEAMLAGLPCIVSKIRGNVDLIEEGKGGCLIPAKDAYSFSKAITELAQNQELREQYGQYNMLRVKSFDLDVVKQQMVSIYNELVDGRVFN